MQTMIYLLTAFFLLLSGGFPGVWQESTPSVTPTPGASLLFPTPGQALQGTISITGSTSVPGFVSSELAFSYADDPTGTWFLIEEKDEPVANGEIGRWDTTLISDGIYAMRLVVTARDNRQYLIIVEGLRVRNYTPVETDTPTPVLPTATPKPEDTPVPTLTSTPTATPVPPTPTQLPPNPSQLSDRKVWASAGQGAMAVLGFFALMALYGSVRLLRKKDRD